MFLQQSTLLCSYDVTERSPCDFVRETGHPRPTTLHVFCHLGLRINYSVYYCCGSVAFALVLVVKRHGL